MIYDPPLGCPRARARRPRRSPVSRTAESSAVFRRTGCTGPGIALLNQYPLPNLAQPAGQGYNHWLTTPVRTTLSYTPVIRLDYHASSRFRLTGKWAGQNAWVKPAVGSLPGFNDTLQKFPLSLNTSVTANYAVNTTTFFEATYGVSQNRLGSPPIGANTNRNSVVCPPDLGAVIGNCTLGRIAFLFPDCRRDRSALLRIRRAPIGGCALLPGWPESAAAEVGVVGAGNDQSRVDGRLRWRLRAAEPRLSGIHEHQPDTRCHRQRDQGRWESHRQGGALPQPQLQRAEPPLEPGFPGSAEFRQRRDQSS